MKTLDEVIKAWSICFSDNSRSDCTGCPYADDDGDAACFNHDREDALHYLKTYRENQQTYIENSRKAEEARERYLEVLTDYVAVKQYWAEQQANPALTWEDLKLMEGKPVWVEADHAFIQYTGWVLLDKIKEDDPDFTGVKFTCPDRSEFFLLADFIGKTWQAYRKEVDVSAES